MGDDRNQPPRLGQDTAPINVAQPQDDVLPEVADAARDEAEYPSDETDEG
ncbi:MAG: hypothetical protein ACLPVY_22265 [Acidimicrobiia bacterium]